jgi:hypothetical protein
VPISAGATTGSTIATIKTIVNTIALRQIKRKIHADVPSAAGASEGFRIAFVTRDF